MKKIWNTRFLSFTARFSMLFLITWVAASILFLMIQNSLPPTSRVALDLYEPFRPVGLGTLIPQFLRSLVFSMILYPFYELFFYRQYGKWVLFGALWGVALFGSVEPMPGSMEGIIYVQITFLEHLLVHAIIGLQVFLFIWLFFKWEIHANKSYSRNDSSIESIQTTDEKSAILNADTKKQNSAWLPGNLMGYTIRFTFVHVLTYWMVGAAFYQISDYEEALASMEIFELWRSLENPIIALIALFSQFVRGPILALLLYPFLHKYVNKNHGWFLLFSLLFGLTALGSPIFITGLLEFDMPLTEYLGNLLIGLPEILVQMLLFSILFYKWQKKHTRFTNTNT